MRVAWPTPTRAHGALAADAWGALLRVHAALVPRLDRELQAAHRLPLAWYDVLLELNAAPDRRLRMSELGDRVMLSRTRVSRLVDEMSAAGPGAPRGEPRRPALGLRGHHRQAAAPCFRQAAPTYLAGIDRHFGAALTLPSSPPSETALDQVIRRAADRSPA